MRPKLTRFSGVLALAAALRLGGRTETAAFVPPSACGAGRNNALELPPRHPGHVAFISSRCGVVRFARGDGSSGDGDDGSAKSEGEGDEEFYESLKARMGEFKDAERDEEGLPPPSSPSSSPKRPTEDGRSTPEFGPREPQRDREPKGDDAPDKSWLRRGQPQPQRPISRRRPSLFSPDDGGGGADGDGEGGRSTPRVRMMRTESNLVSRATSGTTIALQAALTLSFLALQVFVFATGGISDGSDRFPDESAYMLTDKEVQALERVDDGSGPWRGGGGAVSGGDLLERSLDEDGDGPIVL